MVRRRGPARSRLRPARLHRRRHADRRQRIPQTALRQPRLVRGGCLDDGGSSGFSDAAIGAAPARSRLRRALSPLAAAAERRRDSALAVAATAAWRARAAGQRGCGRTMRAPARLAALLGLDGRTLRGSPRQRGRSSAVGAASAQASRSDGRGRHRPGSTATSASEISTDALGFGRLRAARLRKSGRAGASSDRRIDGEQAASARRPASSFLPKEKTFLMKPNAMPVPSQAAARQRGAMVSRPPSWPVDRDARRSRPEPHAGIGDEREAFGARRRRRARPGPTGACRRGARDGAREACVQRRAAAPRAP